MNNKALTTKDDKPKTTEGLIASIKHTKQREFLETYNKCKCRTDLTAKAVSIGESTVYQWRNLFPIFSEAVEAIKKDYELGIKEQHIDNVRSIAFDPKVPPQSRLLGSFFELKALDDRYKDRLPASNVNIGEIIVHSAIPRPVYPEIEGEYTGVEEHNVT